MNILVSGSTGLIGSALVRSLRIADHRVAALVRGKPDAPDVQWDPHRGTIDAARLDGFDAVVHLAGENIAKGLWTGAKKDRIRSSRVDGTRLLCRTLARTPRPPRTLICASAIGYYGDRGDEVLSEDSAAGNDFLANVCREWEAAADAARDAGIRVVHLRIGVVLDPAGGALRPMLPLFRLGLGGRLGSGRQFMSWITRTDVIRVVCFALQRESLAGPVNTVAPHAVTNREFTRTLGTVLRRPTILPAPAFALRLVLREMADALLLSSTRVEPARLRAEGFEFEHPELEDALRAILDRH